MRKLIVVNIISLDSYFEGPGKNVMALPFDSAFDEYNLEVMRGAGSLLFGRTSFEQAKMYWPPIAGDSTKGPTEREISRLFGVLDKTVVSDGLTHQDTAPWDANTTVVKRAGAHEAVGALKNRPGEPVVIFGSHILWNDLLSAGLVDELHFLIGPALLGDGTPVFNGSKAVPLRLISSRTLENSQLVLARYSTQT